MAAIAELPLTPKRPEQSPFTNRQIRNTIANWVREGRGKGVVRGVELVADAATNKPFPPGRKLGPLLKRTAIRNGIILRIDPDWFAVCPALIAERSDIDRMVELIEKSLQDALDLWVKSESSDD